MGLILARTPEFASSGRSYQIWHVESFLHHPGAPLLYPACTPCCGAKSFPPSVRVRGSDWSSSSCMPQLCKQHGLTTKHFMIAWTFRHKLCFMIQSTCQPRAQCFVMIGHFCTLFPFGNARVFSFHQCAGLHSFFKQTGTPALR